MILQQGEVKAGKEVDLLMRVVATMEVWGIKISEERMSRTLRIVKVEESCESEVGR